MITHKEVQYRTLDFLGYPHYRIGTDGSFWTEKVRGGGGLLRPWTRVELKLLKGKSKCPYYRVCVSKNSKMRVLFIHQLVLIAFVGPRPQGSQACHRDGDHLNNKVDNLYWGTPKQNAEDRIKHGKTQRGSRNIKAKLTEEQARFILSAYDSGKHSHRGLAKEFEVSVACIGQLVRGRTWPHLQGARLGKIHSIKGLLAIRSALDVKEETWRDVPSFECYYQVSSWGRVKSLKRTVRMCNNKIRVFPECGLKPDLVKGYERVTLFKNGGHTKKPVHRLVLEAFVGPCPEHMEGCHNDGNCRNNKLDNLRWDTSSANCLEKITNRGELNKLAKVTEEDVRKIRFLSKSVAYSPTKIGLEFGLNPNTVGSIVQRKTWKHVV